MNNLDPNNPLDAQTLRALGPAFLNGAYAHGVDDITCPTIPDEEQ